MNPRRALATLALMGAFAGCRPAAAPEQVLSPADIAARSTSSIVTVHTLNGFGTGFVVGDGLVATNLHVVAGAKAIKVTFADKRAVSVVAIAASSDDYDLAILRVDTRKLTPLRLGDRAALRPGEPVVAIGHPLGLEDTVSNGLLSAVRTSRNGFSVLQISAPIAPGSSGGPIFNEHGEVIGVATLLLVEGQNLNFGVPIRYLKALIEQPSPEALDAFASRTSPPEQESPPPYEKKQELHPKSVLEGCSVEALEAMVAAFSDAVDAASPLYNQGKYASAYQLLVGASMQIENGAPSSCKGPVGILAEARTRAARLEHPSHRAWAMRDAVDALVTVIEKKRRSKP